MKKKPVRDLTGDQYLRLTMASDDKLLELSISEQIEGNTSSSYFEELKQLYQKVSDFWLDNKAIMYVKFLWRKFQNFDDINIEKHWE